jgi:dienelactone hydrolase
MRRWFVIAMMVGMVMSAQAKLHSEAVIYHDGGTALQGYLVYDDAVSGPRPGVLVAHEWWGLNNYPKHRADMLAQLGYIALALDMYGNGYVAATQPDAQAKATGLYANPALMRSRARAGLEVLRRHPLCDTTRVAAIGYCFGGKVALELARDGAPLTGVVTFHGALKTANPDDAKNIKAKVLVCHGGDDPFVPAADVAAFEDEMRKGGVEWQVNVYGGAVHAFTNPASGNDPTKGVAYNAAADKRSWEAMKNFCAEIFVK